MHVPRAGLWDTEHPQLYILHLEILKYGQVMDSEEVRFGFRSIEMKTDGCYLNGSRIEIRGLNRHQSWLISDMLRQESPEAGCGNFKI